jgi:hypothetical protein
MIKPDLVEVGGDFVYPADEDPSIGIVTTSKDFVHDGLFAIDNGTSLSSAKISNIIAKLWNEYPSASSNLIKALLISSCAIPQRVPFHGLGQYRSIGSSSPCCPSTIDEDRISSVYGYGLPNVHQAKYSDINRVVLLDESTIKLESAKFYEIPMPDGYFNADGDKELSVALCFDPQTKRTRGDSYLGCTMGFRLHRGSSLDELKAKYIKLEDPDSDDVTDPKEIPLFPRPMARGKGCMQKGSTILKRPRYSDESLQLAVICKDKWIGDSEYEQKYAITVRVAHNHLIDLYSPIKSKIDIRMRARVRI